MAGSGPNVEGANEPVSASSRLGRVPVSMSWWTLCSAAFYLYLGPSLALAFGTVNAIVGIILSVICYAAISRFYVRRAVATGLSAELMSERIFGKRGAALTALIVAVTALYYGVFEGSILAAVISKLFSQVGYVAACAIVAAMTIPFIWSGRILNHIERANFLLLPIYLIGITLLFITAGSEYGWSGKWLSLGPADPSPYGWWDCFVAYMGVWVLLVITADFARFGRKEDAGFHATFTFGLPFYAVTFLLNGLIGIFLVGTVELGELSEIAVVDAIMAVMGVLAGFAFITATQLRINLANFYVATANTNAVIYSLARVRLPHYVVILLVCLLAFVLMSTGSVFRYMLVSLQFMGIFLCSWIGVTLLARSATFDDAPPVAWRKGAMSAWLLAAALGVAFSFAPGKLASFAAPAAFLSAVLLFKIFQRHEVRTEDQAAAAAKL